MTREARPEDWAEVLKRAYDKHRVSKPEDRELLDKLP